jgi:hypothetical protein
VIGETKIEIKERHSDGLDLKYLSKRIQPALTAAVEERARMTKWQSQKVGIDAVAAWADGPLSKEWAKKAAARVFHICNSGRDVEIDDPFASGAATKKPIRHLGPVPGAPARASTKYDVAQAMSFLATNRKNTEERFAWQDGIPRLLKQLDSKRLKNSAPTTMRLPRVSGQAIRELTGSTERTKVGEQPSLPGTDLISNAEVAKRRAAEPLRPKARQKQADGGLFSNDNKQTDLIDLVKREAKD